MSINSLSSKLRKVTCDRPWTYFDIALTSTQQEDLSTKWCAVQRCIDCACSDVERWRVEVGKVMLAEPCPHGTTLSSSCTGIVGRPVVATRCVVPNTVGWALDYPERPREDSDNAVLVGTGTVLLILVLIGACFLKK